MSLAAAPARPAVGAAVAVLGAVALGALYPLTATRLHPVLLPVVVVGAVLAAVSLRRIEVGIAIGLPLVALNSDVAGPLPWVPGLAWAGLLFLIVLLRPSDETSERHLPPLGLLVLLNLAVLAIGFARSSDPASAVALFRSAITGIFLFFAIATQVRTRQQVAWVIGGFAAGLALTGGYATFQLLTGTGIKSGFITDTGQLVDRVAGGLAHPNQLGGFIALVIPILLGAVLAGSRHAVSLLGVTGIGVIGLYASFSRGAIVGLAAGSLLLLRPRALVLVLPLVLALALAMAPEALSERFETSSGGGAELSSRTDIWRTADAIWRENAVLGTGAGSFADAYSEARVPGKQFLPDTDFLPPPHAHNLYLNLLAEVGLVGAALFTALLGLAARRASALRRSADRWVVAHGRGMLAALAAIAIHNIFDVTLLEQAGSYLWAAFGLVSALTVIASAPIEELA